MGSTRSETKYSPRLRGNRHTQTHKLNANLLQPYLAYAWVKCFQQNYLTLINGHSLSMDIILIFPIHTCIHVYIMYERVGMTHPTITTPIYSSI